MPGATTGSLHSCLGCCAYDHGASTLYLELPEQYKEVYRSRSDQYGEIIRTTRAALGKTDSTHVVCACRARKRGEARRKACPAWNQMSRRCLISYVPRRRLRRLTRRRASSRFQPRRLGVCYTCARGAETPCARNRPRQPSAWMTRWPPDESLDGIWSRRLHPPQARLTSQGIPPLKGLPLLLAGGSASPRAARRRAPSSSRWS